MTNDFKSASSWNNIIYSKDDKTRLSTHLPLSMFYSNNKKPEDQWLCKRSPDIWAYT